MKITLEATHIELDADAKTISGCLVRFGEQASPSVGPAKIMFMEGTHSLAAQRVWLNVEHEKSRRIGWTEELDVRPEGIWATWNILPTTAGRDALVEAEQGARHAFSVEAEVVEHEEVDGVVLIAGSSVSGAALTAFPAIASALVEQVAATESPMPEEAEVEVEAAVEVPPMPLITTKPRDVRMGDIAASIIMGDTQEYRSLIEAAAPHTLSSEVTGLIPAPIVGGLLKNYEASSPLFNALGAKAAPNTNLFTLPLVSTRVEPAAVAAEKTDVTKQLVITDVSVDMVGIKRAVNVSEEAIAWSGAGDLLQIVADQLAEAVVSGREAYTTAALEAVAGGNAAVSIAANGADAWAKLSGAKATAYKAIGSTPDLAVLTIDTWAKLAGFTNTNGAPLINGMQQDLMGGYGSLFGMPIVVSPTATKSYLVDRKRCFSFVNANVRASLNEATIGGRAFFIMQGVGCYFTPKGTTQISVATS